MQPAVPPIVASLLAALPPIIPSLIIAPATAQTSSPAVAAPSPVAPTPIVQPPAAFPLIAGPATAATEAVVPPALAPSQFALPPASLPLVAPGAGAPSLIVLPPAGQPPARLEAGPQVSAPAEQLQMEVVSFRLQGRQPWQRVKIPDLDEALTPGKERLLPLLRVLDALKIDYTQSQGQISFQPSGMPEVTVDTRNRRMVISEKTTTITLIQTDSIITHAPDVYVPVSAFADMLAMDLHWNEQSYEFVGTTERVYETWRAAERASLLGLSVKEVPADLPELFPPNRPEDWSLDFMEVRARGQVQAIESGDNHPGVAADSLTESFWGRAAGGRYYLEWAEPTMSWDHTNGTVITPSSPLLLNWGELVFERTNSEIALGDSNFALNEVAFPFTRLTGVQVHGMTGVSEETASSGVAGRGAQRSFLRPLVFQGFARVGSKAELFINDRSVATDEVLTTFPGAQTDEGLWHFKDVTLPPGTTNEIRIVVTDTSGVKIQVVRTIVSTTSLVPKGQIAYTTGIGTDRDSQSWSTRGLMGGARGLYGVTDRLSVGGFMAAEQSFNLPQAANDALNPNALSMPQSSAHIGVELCWQTFDSLTFYGTFAVSARKQEGGETSTGDSAYSLREEFSPTSDLNFHATAFRYGTNYFNGVAIQPNDREGETIGARWKMNPHWTAGGSFGTVSDNLDNQLPNTTNLDFETFKIQTDLIPKTTARFEVDQIATNLDGSPENIFTWDVSTSLPYQVALEAIVAVGSSLIPKQDINYFTGLNVPDLPLYLTPTTTVQLRKTFEINASVGATYEKSDNLQRLSVLQDWHPMSLPRLRIFTEAGWDFEDSKVYFDHRDEYYLTPRGSVRVGLQLHSERGQQAALLVLTINELFAVHDDTVARISDWGLAPWDGGIQGQVLLNVEGDGRPREGDPGVPDVKVSNSITNATTDANGYFVLPGDVRLGKDHVFLDTDTVQATLTVTNGVQSVYVGPNSLTRAYLTVTPAHYAKGFVYLLNADGKQEPISGAKISLIRQKDQKPMGESFTANDGSYYLGNIPPGDYTLVVAHDTLPSTCELPEDRQPLKVLPKAEMTEYNLPPFLARQRPQPAEK